MDERATEFIQYLRYEMEADHGQGVTYDAELMRGDKRRYFLTVPFALDEEQVKVLLMMVQQMRRSDGPKLHDKIKYVTAVDTRK